MLLTMFHLALFINVLDAKDAVLAYFVHNSPNDALIILK